jgi:hypothetical protein
MCKGRISLTSEASVDTGGGINGDGARGVDGVLAPNDPNTDDESSLLLLSQSAFGDGGDENADGSMSSCLLGEGVGVVDGVVCDEELNDLRKNWPILDLESHQPITISQLSVDQKREQK